MFSIPARSSRRLLNTNVSTQPGTSIDLYWEALGRHDDSDHSLQLLEKIRIGDVLDGGEHVSYVETEDEVERGAGRVLAVEWPSTHGGVHHSGLNDIARCHKPRYTCAHRQLNQSDRRVVLRSGWIHFAGTAP